MFIRGSISSAFFQKFKAGLPKTHSKLAHEIKRIVTLSTKLGGTSLEELEAALIAADLGVAVTAHIVAAVKQAYETQGGAGLDVFAIARDEMEKGLGSNKTDLIKAAHGPTSNPGRTVYCYYCLANYRIADSSHCRWHPARSHTGKFTHFLVKLLSH